MNEPERQQPGKTLGRGMWIMTWITGFALLTLWFGNQEQQWRNPNQNPITMTDTSGAQEVVLERNRQGHYVMSGYINGQVANFLLDTGATDVALSRRMAERFGLQPGRAYIAATANGNVEVRATRIAELRIGEILLRDVSASIVPNMDDHVLLGMSALRHIEFSQRDGRLTLRYYP